MADKFEQLKEQSHPNLMSKSAMMAASGTRGSNELLFWYHKARVKVMPR